MGAAQSKKRRKERKRRRKHQDSSGHFDIPRSLSLDALRTYGVTSPSSAAVEGCPHCGGWSWSGLADLSFSPTGSNAKETRGHTRERRTFSGLLESSSVCHGTHRCLQGQYDDLHGGYDVGYDSEGGGYGSKWRIHRTRAPMKQQHSWPASTSLGKTAGALPSTSPAHMPHQPPMLGPNDSEMSELLTILARQEQLQMSRQSRRVDNQDLSPSSDDEAPAIPPVVHAPSSRMVRSRDSQSALTFGSKERSTSSSSGCAPGTRHQKQSVVRRSVVKGNFPDQSCRIAVSGDPRNVVVEAPKNAVLTIDKSAPPSPITPPVSSSSASPPVTPISVQINSSHSSTEKPSSTTREEALTSSFKTGDFLKGPSSPSSTNNENTNNNTTAKKTFSVLEDEETRLARWEKQRKSAEQLRLLRQHLMAREAADASVSSNDPGLSFLPITNNSQDPPAISIVKPSEKTAPRVIANTQASVRGFLIHRASVSQGDKVSVGMSCNTSRLRAQAVDGKVSVKDDDSKSTSSCNTLEPSLSSFDSNPESTDTAYAASVSSFSSSRQDSLVPPTLSPSPSSTSMSSAFSESLVSPSLKPQLATNAPRSSKLVRSSDSFRSVENHPILSRLQNEQNSRLERMERKMRNIWASAEKEAERKKFAKIFPARQDVIAADERRRIKEAEESLEKIKAEKKKKQKTKKEMVTKSPPVDSEACSKEETVEAGVGVAANVVGKHNRPPPTNSIVGHGNERNAGRIEDSGEIIPVQIVSQPDTDSSVPWSSNDHGTTTSSVVDNNLCNTETKLGESTPHGSEKPQDDGKDNGWLDKNLPGIDLGKPVAWLTLPFLLFPILLRLLLSVAMTLGPEQPSPSSPMPENNSSYSNDRMGSDVVDSTATNKFESGGAFHGSSTQQTTTTTSPASTPPLATKLGQAETKGHHHRKYSLKAKLFGGSKKQKS